MMAHKTLGVRGRIAVVVVTFLCAFVGLGSLALNKSRREAQVQATLLQMLARNDSLQSVIISNQRLMVEGAGLVVDALEYPFTNHRRDSLLDRRRELLNKVQVPETP